MTATDPRVAVDALAASREPYLLGVRHHSPALAAVVPALLDASGADVVCVELPAEFQPWLEHLADPETVAPVALAGTGEAGHLAFYPFADFSPELAAIRWAHRSGAAVLCCDLPLSDRRWTSPATAEHPAPAASAEVAVRAAVSTPGRGASAPSGAARAAVTASAGVPAQSTGPDSPRDQHPGQHPGQDPGQDPGRTLSLSAGAPASYADGLVAAGTGREGEDLWDRAVEVLAPGCSPEAVRRAALAVGWALRADTATVPAPDLAREAHMRGVIARATANGHRVAAVIGAFHAPALLDPAHGVEAAPHTPLPAAASGTPCAPARAEHGPDAAGEGASVPAPDGAARPRPGRQGSATVPHTGFDPGPAETGTAVTARPTPAGRSSGPAFGVDAADAVARGGLGDEGSARAEGAGAGPAGGSAGLGPGVTPRPASGRAGFGRDGEGGVTSLVPYSFDLLDSRSGYPAGIRDPLWQQAVLEAAGDPGRVREAASVALTRLCRELRRAGHTAGTGEAAETLRLACDLAVLRGLPAPGRGELLEAVTTVLGQGEPLGRGRALARALEAVLVGTARGRITPHAPRSGLGPGVEAELAALRLPSPEDPTPREIRLDPLRSPLDGRREVLLQRLLVCGASYGEPLTVAATGDGTALGTKWRLSWTPSVPARLDLAGVRGVTAAQAAAGTLRDTDYPRGWNFGVGQRFDQPEHRTPTDRHAEDSR
ncbi:DUF5682 family protein, partial [Streptomyces sp. NPDC023588]|uniref:DUF5682 family protein n=1 Tax=Streptomyces sp. NPDC023588 TaxID=3154907 RepID=UPI0033E1ECF4